MYIIEAPSAVAGYTCLIGDGLTEDDAWSNAYGPKPWTPYVQHVADDAWAREITLAEWAEMKEDAGLRASQRTYAAGYDYACGYYD